MAVGLGEDAVPEGVEDGTVVVVGVVEDIAVALAVNKVAGGEGAVVAVGMAVVAVAAGYFAVEDTFQVMREALKPEVR